MRPTGMITIALVLILLAPALAGCGSGSDGIASGPVESYIAMAPRIMHAGEHAAVTFTLLGSLSSAVCHAKF